MSSSSESENVIVEYVELDEFIGSQQQQQQQQQQQFEEEEQERDDDDNDEESNRVKIAVTHKSRSVTCFL